MLLPLVAAAAMAAQPGCAGGLCNIRALDPWFDKLARMRRGPDQRPLHILQIGDSHTAGDTITGGWRDMLQARYGSGGRGMLAPGRPYSGYLTRGVTAEMSPGWRIAATFGSASAPPRPALGLSGFTLTTSRAGAKIALQADASEMFDRFVLCGALEPDAGSVTVTIGTLVQRINLDSPTARPECRTITLDQPQFRVEVTSDSDRPVTLTSWATFRDTGGIALSNVGVVGSQLQHFARTDDQVLAEELRTYRPDLIVVAFGTNEGFAPIFRPGEFEITLRTQISRLRRLAPPGTPILLLGSPDAMTRRPEMAINAPGPRPSPCPEPLASRDAPPPPAPPAVALGPVAEVMEALRRDDGPAPDVSAPPPLPVVVPPPAAPPAIAWTVRADPLFPPAGLRSVREVQRRVAAQLGVAFWDWEARMGGACSSVHWVKDQPARMRGDYVHYNSAGGRDIAQRLQADLEAAAAVEARR